MIFSYIRVSSKKQTLKNQRYEIVKFAKENNLKVNQFIEEKVSGTVNYKKRQLGVVISKMKKGDILLCTEISRLGRTILQIMTILNICMQKEVQVWTIKENYRLGVDIQSKVLAFAFSLSAEIERNLISQRTKEALRRIQANGKKLGRNSGSRNKRRKLDGLEDEIRRLLNQGYSKRAIAQKYGVSISTMYNFLLQHEKAEC